ncbi:MAG: family 16 glycosylhydrolase [Pseudomonadota bacterium]
MADKTVFTVLGAMAAVVGVSAGAFISFASAGVNETEAMAAPIPKPGPRLEGPGPFHETFDSYNKKLWRISDGWRNGDWTVNDWRRSQAKIDGELTLKLDKNKTDIAEFSGGEIQTHKKYGHGYFETRMQAAKAPGSVSAFFTYTGPPFKDLWNEIDVEILGNKPREVMFTYFTDGEKREHIHQLPFDTTEGMHTYAFDWQPGHLRWYVDGEMVHEASAAELPLPRSQQKIMASLWASTTLDEWVGRFDPEALPSSAKISCITYAKDYASRIPCE